jgi:hypothetical protein
MATETSTMTAHTTATAHVGVDGRSRPPPPPAMPSLASSFSWRPGAKRSEPTSRPRRSSGVVAACWLLWCALSRARHARTTHARLLPLERSSGATEWEAGSCRRFFIGAAVGRPRQSAWPAGHGQTRKGEDQSGGFWLGSTGGTGRLFLPPLRCARCGLGSGLRGGWLVGWLA